MHIHMKYLIVVFIVVALAWWANETLNKVPNFKQIAQVIIVVVGILCLLYGIGLIDSSHVSIES